MKIRKVHIFTGANQIQCLGYAGQKIYAIAEVHYYTRKGILTGTGYAKTKPIWLKEIKGRKKKK